MGTAAALRPDRRSAEQRPAAERAMAISSPSARRSARARDPYSSAATPRAARPDASEAISSRVASSPGDVASGRACSTKATACSWAPTSRARRAARVRLLRARDASASASGPAVVSRHAARTCAARAPATSSVPSDSRCRAAAR